ncbi:MAG TPA: hypothetical protein ENJ18_09995 [Nannocystis exedens]|nr:hypothetical protein [Nannocystis exedens]
MQLARRRLLFGLLAIGGGSMTACQLPVRRDRKLKAGSKSEGSRNAVARGQEERISDAPEIELWFGGDLHLGDLGPEVLAPLRTIVPAHAIGVLNLEGPIAASVPERPFVAGELPVLRNSEAVPVILRDLGIEVIGVANNHMNDFGEVGRRQTIEQLQAAGLVVAGGDAGVALIERGGIRLAITAHYLRSELDPEAKLELASRLRGAGAQADHLVATFHVDGPPSYLPSTELRAAVEVAIEASATLVVAHGSHALARLERRDGTLIAWGLGNLAFACRCTDELDAALLRVRLGRHALTLAEWIPIAAGIEGAPVARHPDPGLLIDLLASLGSSPGQRVDDRYRLDL